jgi:hypothetical protein
MSSACSGETRAGAFSLCKPLLEILPRLRGTPGSMALATSFMNVFVDFEFKPLLLVMKQHQLIGQPAKGWSRPV